MEEHFYASSGLDVWVVIDGHKVGISEFLLAHPGGPAVLIANAGRDASADFHHVSAHANPAVAARLKALTIAPVEKQPVESAWTRLLSYLLLVRNAFPIHDQSVRPHHLQHIFLVQSLAHLADDHLPAFWNQLHHIAARPARSIPSAFKDLVASASVGLTTEVDRAAATVSVQSLRADAASLIHALVGFARRGIDEHALGTGPSLAEEALAEIDSWFNCILRPAEVEDGTPF